jgi:superfamily II DNA or RNA helicase
MVKIVIGNVYARIIGLSDEAVLKEIDLKFSYMVQGHQFMRNSGWDGRYRLFKRNAFPVGLLSSAEEILKGHGIKYEIQDNREVFRFGKDIKIDPDSGFEIRDYQVDAVDRAFEAERGVIRISTGGGKSLIIAMLAAKFNVRAVIYVIGVDLLYQMRDTIQRAFPHIRVGMVGDGHCDIQKVTVCTIWSAAAAFGKKAVILDNDTTQDRKSKNKFLNKEKTKEMVRSAQMFILDECQYSGSDTVQFLHKESRSARFVFLLSATPWREAGDDILIEAVGGPRIVDIDASKLIDEGWLVPPEIHFLDIPMLRGVGKNYHEIYNNYIVDNDVRNQKLVDATKKLVAAGKKVLILVVKVDHGKILQGMFDDDLRVASLDGRNKSSDRISVINAMKSGRLDVLISSKIFDQGIDIPELDALVLAGSGKSSARALQRIGRVIRRRDGKKNAIVVDTKDNCKYLREHSNARFRIYSTEPRFKIKMPRRKK